MLGGLKQQASKQGSPHALAMHVAMDSQSVSWSANQQVSWTDADT